MVLNDPQVAVDAEAEAVGPAISIERLAGLKGDAGRRAAAGFALVLAESFGVDGARRAAMEVETIAMLDRPEIGGCLVSVDGEPAAVAKRTTFDGASYLSSIGTRPVFRGRGLGRLATAAATVDAVLTGSRWTYLGVFSENEAARRLYRRLGYDEIGGPAPDLMLR
ncbi:MAG TPA: GNAT family N-acetyltransferase, partial [Vitreimonas sp.]|nr:GNAT family N-acetyltransferase [Vitreimonas sp.]